MWNIQTTDTFDEWYSTLDDPDRKSVLAALLMLKKRGPLLPRPYVDTVKGSMYPNLKELRVQSKGKPIRAFFAFDPERQGILLCAGHKGGVEKRFYQTMVPKADEEYTAHLNKIRGGKNHGKNT